MGKIKTQIDNRIRLIDLSWERAFLSFVIETDGVLPQKWNIALMMRPLDNKGKEIFSF